MNKKYLNVKLYVWLSFLMFSLLFLAFPEIDLYVSGLFFDGDVFWAKNTVLEQLFYNSVKPVLILFTSVIVLLFLYNKYTKKEIFNINAKTLLFAFLVLSIAPGLIVNAILKENWGRARPTNIIEFHGHKEFTPAFVLSDQNGYSFSSGHTAAAFSLLGFVLLAKRKRQFFLALALSYGIAVSIARMAAGGHFISDVMTSFFIVWIATHIFYKLVFKEDS